MYYLIQIMIATFVTLSYSGRQPSRQEFDTSRNGSQNRKKRGVTKEQKQKLEYFSLLARKNNGSRKQLVGKTSGIQANHDSHQLKAHDISVVEMDENSNTENLVKEKSEITALEHLSYINA